MQKIKDIFSLGRSRPELFPYPFPTGMSIRYYKYLTDNVKPNEDNWQS